MIFSWINRYDELAVNNTSGWEHFRPDDYLMRFYVEDDDPDPWDVFFYHWLTGDDPGYTTGIVLDRWWHWDDPAERVSADYVLAQLANAHERLPLLRALFVGNVTDKKWDISWITQGNYAPVLAAYPQLESLVIRGSSGLSFGAVQHQQLNTLVVQTTGLPAQAVREIAAADLPTLEHLELWMGCAYHGGNSTVADLQPMLNGTGLPNLTTLALRNCEYADDLAHAPILERIKILDLSLGNLSDVGAEALFASPAIRKLSMLVLHYHYMSDAMLDCWSAINLAVEVSCQQIVEDSGDGEDKEPREIAIRESLA